MPQASLPMPRYIVHPNRLNRGEREGIWLCFFSKRRAAMSSVCVCVCALQYSTPDSIRQDMIEYERITLKAAAQVRQKWTES